MPCNICLDKFLGVPYKKYGRDMDGLDCYGFVRMVLKDGGIDIPEYRFEHDGEQRDVFMDLVEGRVKDTPSNFNIVYLEPLSPGREHIGVYVDGLVWQMVEPGIFSSPWRLIEGRVKEIYEIEV